MGVGFGDDTVTSEDLERYERQRQKRQAQAAPENSFSAIRERPAPSPPVSGPEKSFIADISGQTPFPPLDDDIDVDTPTGDTGEPWWQWFDRRLNIGLSRLGFMGAQFAVELATSHVSDEEVSGVADLIAQANAETKMGMPPPRITKAREQGLTDEQVDAVRRAMLDHEDVDLGVLNEASDIDTIAIGWDRALKRTSGLTDDATARALGFTSFQSLVAYETLALEQDTQTAVAFFGASNEQIEALVPDKGLKEQGLDALGFLGGFFEPMEMLYRNAVGPAVSVLGQATVELAHTPARILNAAEEAVGIDIIPDSPEPIGFKEVFDRAKAIGPGRSIFIAAGVEPGTVPFRYGTAALDFVTRIVADPLNVVGKVGAGLKATTKIAGKSAAGATLPAPANLRGVAKATFDRFSMTPDELVRAPKAQRTVKKIASEVKRQRNAGERNLARIVDEFDVPAALADEIHQAKNADEITEIISDAMNGRVTGQTISKMERTVAEIDDELTRLAVDMSDPKIPTLTRMKSELNDIINSRQAQAGQVLRELPEASTLRQAKNSLKRPDRNTRYGRTVGFFTDSDWIRKYGRARGRIPNRSISLTNRDAFLDDLQALGRLARVPQALIDDVATKAVDATSFGELRDIYGEILKLVKDEIPTKLGSELTQYIDNPNASIYAVDKAGRAAKNWVKSVVRREVLDDNSIAEFSDEFAQPVFHYQLAQELPLPNLRNIIEAKSWAGRFRLFLKGMGRSSASETLSDLPVLGKAASGTAEAMRVTSHLVSAVTSGFWVPTVLIRLGWPLRVVGEEQLRLYSAGLFPLEETIGHMIGRIAGRGNATMLDVPEEALSHYGRLAYEMRSSRDVVGRGTRGYHPSLAEQVRHLHGDQVARKIVGGSDEEVVEWLTRGGGRRYLDDYQPTLDAMGKTVEDWVAAQREAIEAIAGGSDVLKEAIRTGKYKVAKKGNKIVATADDAEDLAEISVRSSEAEGVLRRLPQSTLPRAVGAASDFWQATDDGLLRKFASVMLEWLGSKPTNVLSRSPAYRSFFKAEQARLKALGWSDNLANSTAKDYAIRQVGELLYDAGERSAFDVMNRNLAPFMPAWKEVLKRWTQTIPGHMGAGVGHAVLAHRLQVAWDALRDQGVIQETDEGDFEIRLPGLDKAFSFSLDVTGLKAGFNIRSFNILSGLPGLGPVPTVVAHEMAKRSEAFDALVEPLFPYGIDPQLGSRNLSRIWRAIFGSTPPWAPFDNKYQELLFDMSVVDWMRTPEGKTKIEEVAAMPIQTAEERDAREKAAADLLEWFEGKARSVMFRRGLFGLGLPAQPRLYWPGTEERDELFRSIDNLGPTEASTAIREFYDRHPELVLSRLPKTILVDGELDRETSLEQYFKELKIGKRKSIEEVYGESSSVHIAIGIINYETIRRRKMEALADLGETGADWLNNRFEYDRIQDRFRAELQRERVANPVWAQFWDDRIKAAKERAEEPLPTLDEEIAADFLTNMRAIESMFDDVFSDDDFDQGVFARIKTQLNEGLDLERFYGDPEDIPDGAQKDVVTYFRDHYIPYWEGISEIRARTIDKKNATKDDVSRGYLEIARFKNEYEPAVINGVEYPSPEQAAFNRHTVSQQEAQKIKWATGRYAWMSPFQREALGMKKNDDALRFWDAVQANRNKVDSIIRENAWPSGKREAVNLRNQLAAWEEQAAKALGVMAEYRQSQQPAYKRVEALGLGESRTKAWERVTQAADHVWAILDAQDVSPGSTAGLAFQKQFGDWIGAVRRADPLTDAMLTRQHQATFLADKPVEDFYSFFFFQEGR